MITMPAFLRELVESEAYTNKQHPDYQITNEKVEYYLRTLYPGEMKQDATGKFVAPEYDMTLEQFDEAQRKIDADFEESKDEAEEEILDEYGEYFENLGISFDIDGCVIPGESIPVKVLYYNDTITLRHLETYDLDIPEFEKIQKIWVWHGEASETTCDECESLDGHMFYNEDDVPECPVHPNCRCWVEEIETDEDGNIINRTRFAGNPPANTDTQPTDNTTTPTSETQRENMSADKKFEMAFERLREPEGGYTDGTNQVRDEPTNMGIKQSTLDEYNRAFPEKNFPENVRDLERNQAHDIYKDQYWDNTEIKNIENDRVRNAVFDMNVMGGAGKVVQRALNSYADTTLRVDGVIGSQTRNALNNIPNDAVSEFMETLKNERMEYLQGTRNWTTAQDGWTRRTMAY